MAFEAPVPPGAISNLPWKLEKEGETLCEVYQRVLTALVVVKGSQLAKWGVTAAEVQVDITDTGVTLGRPSDSHPLLQVWLWRPVCPEDSSWEALPDGSLSILLTKHGKHLGSWAYVLQRVEAAAGPCGAVPCSTSASGTGGGSLCSTLSEPCKAGSHAVADQAPQAGGGCRVAGGGAPAGGQHGPAGEAGLSVVWCVDRVAWEQEARQRVQQWMAQREAEAAAAAADIRARLAATRPLGEPFLQVAFLLPSDPHHCWWLLRTSSCLPPVAKLVKMCSKVAALEVWLEAAVDVGALPYYALPALRFAAGLATIEQLREREGLEAVRSADACGGNGCGSEYAVLVFGGVLGLGDALSLLQVGSSQDLCYAVLVFGGVLGLGDVLSLLQGGRPGGAGVLYEALVVHTAVLRARAGGEASLAQHAQQHAAPSWPDDADPAAVACGAAQGTRVDAELAGALALALEGAGLREPRIAVYCHTTGMRYASLDKVREWLPRAAASCGGERKVVAAWLYLGCPEIWRLEDPGEDSDEDLMPDDEASAVEGPMPVEA
ncbi:hypothetical protein N2152v2_008040 [Parachlorella kessleri]